MFTVYLCTEDAMIIAWDCEHSLSNSGQRDSKEGRGNYPGNLRKISGIVISIDGLVNTTNVNLRIK